MPDIWYDVDTALAEVPVNILPLIDDTDFKAIEGAVAYNAAGLALRWHFVTCAGAYTVTSVTPTTGGAYDWTDQGDSGIYTIEIPASGGASINNDTEGFGWFTGVATGILPWRGPTIGFRAAALNDALIESAWSATRGLAGTALPAVAAGSADGLILGSAANKLAVDAAGKVAVPDTQKVDLNTVKTQAVTCAAGVTILASVGTAATATAQSRDLTDAVLATAIWNAATASYGSAGTYGLLVESANAIVADWTDGGRLDLLLDGVKAKTDGLNFTGTDVKATLDGEEVTPTSASKTGYALSATGLDLIVKFKALLDGTPSGSVVDDNDPDPTATAFETDLTEASNDHYNGAFVVFYSGALIGQSRKISDYDGTTKILTVATAFTEAPVAGNDFLIIGRSE